MSKLLAVAARELRERWLLFPGALVAGFFPLVLPAFGVSREHAPTAGALGAVLFGVATAVIVGSSMLARDAANGQLGFLFSRPLPWGTIWGGKWLAAITLATAITTLTAIPWMVAYPLESLGGHHGESWLRAVWESEGSALLAVILLLAIGLANFNGTAFRSRSPWLAADLLLVLLAGWTVRRTVAPLLSLGIVGIDPVARWGLLAPTLGILATAFFVASAVQAARGRTDLRRAHVAMSVTLWAIVFGVLGLAAARLTWARAARPADLSTQVARTDATGRWVYGFGDSRRGGSPGFLIESASGRFVPLGLLAGWWQNHGAHVFSADGSFAANLVASPDGRASALVRFDLAGPTPRVQSVVFESSPPPSWRSAFDLSPLGSMALLVHETGASLYAVPTGRRVATTTLPPGWRPAATCFLAEDRARVWLVPLDTKPRARDHIQVLDLAAGADSRTTRFELTPAPGIGGSPVVIPDAGGERLLTEHGRLDLRDGATGSLIATLVEAPGRPSAAFMEDGRVFVAERAQGHARLRVFDSSGAPAGETLRESALPLRVGPEVAPGRVAVFAGYADGETLVVDLATLTVVERLEGLVPASSSTGLVPSPVRRPTSVHFFLGRGQLVRIDFSTGERRVVAGPGAPRGERLSVR